MSSGRSSAAAQKTSALRRKPRAGRAADRHGQPVRVGMYVRVLEVDRALKKVIPPDEWRELEAMVGKVFRVCEIDEHGSAWVETSLIRRPDGGTYSHSLALDSHEMEAVSKSRRRRTRG